MHTVSEPERTLRVGVVGTGFMARTDIAAARWTGPTEVVVSYDIVPESAVAFADQFGGIAVRSLEDIATRDDLDAILLCTRHDARVEPLLALARADRIVLCEKPLTLTLAEADTLADALGPLTTRVYLGFNQRFMAGPQALRAVLRDNARTVSAIVAEAISPPFLNSWAGMADTGGGALSCLGSHATDLLAFITGSPWDTVHAFTSRMRLADPLLEDIATISGTLANDTRTHVTTTVHDFGLQWLHMGEGNLVQLKAYTSDGIYAANAFRITAWSDSPVEQCHVNTPGPGSNQSWGYDFIESWGYVGVLREVRRIAFGGTGPTDLATFDDGYRAVRIVHEARQASLRP